MDNFFDKGLHYLGSNSSNTFVMNIGAMDGVMFDEMVGYTSMYKLKGLYVEPIPYLFEKLKSNIGNIDNNYFENSAISDYNGEIEMITIKKDVIDSGVVHNCFYGMSAVYPPKNGLGSEGDKETVDKYGEIVKVPCITFKTLLKKHNIRKVDVIKIDAEGHDYTIFKQIDFKKLKPAIIRLEWINLTQEDQSNILEVLEEFAYIVEVSGQDIVGITRELHNILIKDYKKGIEKEVENHEVKDSKKTIVTGLWDIKRGNLKEGWGRSYDTYLIKLKELLETDINMIIFGDEELEDFVKDHRVDDNTQFIKRDIDWFKNNDYYKLIQGIRRSKDWDEQATWLKGSTQRKLKMYNPIVMSKFFLLNDAIILSKFDSEEYYWLDAGITNTVHQGYFTHDKVLDKISENKLMFLAFPYEASNEVHGFDYEALNKYAGEKVTHVARGGFFGGNKKVINELNSEYYRLLIDTLSKGYMGTEESIFSIMLHTHKDSINYYEINGDGLVSTFFEAVKNGEQKVKSYSKEISTSLYVITFNSPKQFEVLVESMIAYDKDFIEKPIKKYLLDNSTDLSTTPEYLELCEKYGFKHIKKENIGITGGRQFIAEHFEKTGYDSYFFFEDDMAFNNNEDVCKNGFNVFFKNLYNNSIDILKKENFDYLKLNFTEFYGSNSQQWAWHNVPKEFRESHFGNIEEKPFTKFDNIKSLKGVPYVTGEVYLCNWPILVSKKGNFKCYLETVFQYPAEQTIMSHNYQEMVKGSINAGLLLATPTKHERFDHYDSSLRKEN